MTEIISQPFFTFLSILNVIISSTLAYYANKIKERRIVKFKKKIFLNLPNINELTAFLSALILTHHIIIEKIIQNYFFSWLIIVSALLFNIAGIFFVRNSAIRVVLFNLLSFPVAAILLKLKIH
ncbi:hypothetical protein ciss_13700 [Carboxydothermus islandicus]|uniref:Uncharacterized protein n=1 Tax=Carboxydothermus islandicus TaxID=661089 RepID=A0A1L8D2V0_9THEO|nr:hypothetical protein [Carboxydothermus islandicus]GAV25437.1 hypothetical protein ciss_13700 [Carboxydothermus islandicus]